jgi:hypothetical protein
VLSPRRNYVSPRLELEAPDVSLVPVALQSDEVLDELGEGAVQPVGAELEGDVREVLTRLRQG